MLVSPWIQIGCPLANPRVATQPSPPQEANPLESQIPQPLAAIREYAFSYFCSASLILGNVLVLRFALAQFGDDGFNQLLIVRRFASALLPLVSLGLAVNLAKLVPQTITTSGTPKAERLLAAGLQISVLAMAVYLVVAMAVGDWASQWLIGEPHLAHMLVCLSAWLLGLVWTTCNAGFSRGKLWNNWANAVQVGCLSISPLVVLPFVTEVDDFLLVSGLVQISLNALVAWRSVEHGWKTLLTPQWEDWRRLTLAGLPRLPGDFSYYGLLALPAMMTTRAQGLDRGAEVAYGLVMLTLLMQLVAPANQFVLAETAYLSQTGDIRRLRNRLLKISVYAGGITVTGVAVLWCFAPQFIWLHLGKAPDSYVAAVRWIIPAALPLNLFVALKGVADAAYRRAIVPHLSLGTLAAFFVFYQTLLAWGYSEVAVILAFHLSVSLLAVATLTAAAYWLHSQLRQVTPNDISDGLRRAA